MYSRKLYILLVCLGVLLAIGVTDSCAYELKQASFSQGLEGLYAPPVVVEASASAQAKPIPRLKPITKVKTITKVKPEPMVKYRPDFNYAMAELPMGVPGQCILPIPRPRGWEVSGEAFFARTKGKLRAGMGGYNTYYYYGGGAPEVDLNADLGIPDHNVVATISAIYRFRPRWSLRYSIMPLAVNGSGQTSDNFLWGGNFFYALQNARVKWEHLYQRMGIIYDPIRSYSSRVSVYGDYVRINERVSYSNVGFGGGTTVDGDMNMAMAGLEFEKCMKTGRICNTFSIECKAGVAFGDDGFGSDITTNLKYSIPLNNGRWGYVKGGYRYLTYKKKFSEVKTMDLAVSIMSPITADAVGSRPAPRP